MNYLQDSFHAEEIYGPEEKFCDRWMRVKADHNALRIEVYSPKGSTQIDLRSEQKVRELITYLQKALGE